MKKEVKDNKKNVEKKESVVLDKVKAFFNHPAPLFIAFIAIIGFLLVYIYKSNNNSVIYVGGINDTQLTVPSVHYFSNSDMNFFYASTALYDGEYKDKKIYNYEIGYFIKNGKDDYTAFLTRSGKLTDPVKAANIIQEKSTWEFGESATAPKYFTNNVKSKLSELHFIFKGSTDKKSDEADVFIDIPVETEKITR